MNIHYKKQHETDWNTMPMEEVESHSFSFGLPASWKVRVYRGLTVYTDNYMFKLEETEETVPNKNITLDSPVVFNNLSNDTWHEKSGEKLEQMIEMMGGYATNYKERLANGEVITFPLGILKLTDTNICPICRFGYRGMGSLSRRDNQTEICDSCGTMESLQDFSFEQVKEISFNGKRLGFVHTVLYNKFFEYTTLPLEDHLTEWAKEEFGIDLADSVASQTFEDVVVSNGYENVTEWIKEHMRISIKESKLLRNEG